MHTHGGIMPDLNNNIGDYFLSWNGTLEISMGSLDKYNVNRGVTFLIYKVEIIYL